MTATKNSIPLRLLPGGLGMVQPEPRCQLITQAVMAGPQDYRVAGANAQVTGRGHGVITMRVGRLLVYLEDRDALAAWHAALERAEVLADAAFGPELPPAVYQPRSRA